MNALLIGNLTIDHNLTESGKFIGPGGTVYFAAKTFGNLGVNTTIVSPYGDDFPKKYLSKTTFLPKKALFRKTFVFENIYCQESQRKQKVKFLSSVGFKNIKNLGGAILQNNEIVLTAPIVDNFDEKLIRNIRKSLPKSLFVLSPQGFFRKINKNGYIENKKWLNDKSIIELFDMVIFSDKDTKDADKLAQRWSQKRLIVVVTKESRGCSLYVKGERRRDILAFSIEKINDSTGAGDVFTAAFVFAYQKTRNPYTCALFANAVAAFSLRLLPNQLQYEYRDIIDFAEKQGRKIKL